MKISINSLPIGSKVKMVDCFEAETHAGRIWTTGCEPWQLGTEKRPGKWLVLLDGFRGGFSVECLEWIIDKEEVK
jgi:hypothetical protein